MIKVMEDTGASMSNGLGITVDLVNMLPTIQYIWLSTPLR